MTRRLGCPGFFALSLGLMGLLGCAMSGRATAAEPRPPHDTSPKNIVFLAGKKSHGPGAHEYEADAKLLFECLRLSPHRGSLRAAVHFDGWPADAKTLDDADTIVLLSDGLDKPYPREQHPFLRGDHLAVIEKQVRRGCGLVLIHWPLWVPASIGRDKFMPWIGGYCDYETPPGPGMSDRVDWDKQLAHPVCRGLEPFTFQDEYYPNVRFAGDDPRFTAILPFAGRAKDSVWAWTWQRTDGGRSFVYVGGHAHANWRIDPLRKAILNGILWSARAEVPASGVMSKVSGAASGKLSAKALSGDPPQIRTLILTGHHHPGHPWRESTRAIQSVLWRDPRFTVDVIDNPEFLACPHLSDYQLIVLNYCNWERGGLSQAARDGFLRFVSQGVSQGGGLVVSHFADGAFGPGAHPPTPEANWPDFSKLCRRAWIDGKSGHDAYGPFRVVPTGVRHPITAGMKPFDTVDELYFNQQGELPIEPLIAARSKVTGRDEPLAFAYTLGKGRVFQNLLGHAVDSIVGPGPAELLRRGCAWAAGREPVAPGGLRPAFPGTLAALATPAAESTSAPYDPKRMGRSLDLTKTTATVAAAPAFSQQPLSVECWAKVRAKDGFQVLVSSHPKESGEHWELYTYAGSGVLSAYLPGRGGDVRSSRDITDGRWHYLAMVHEPGLVRLFVDGAEVARQGVAVQPNTPAKTGPLAIGFAYAGNHRIGCNGEIDELRISSAARKINGIPAVPFKADGQTLGLWHFDDDPQSKRLDDAAGHRHGTVLAQ